MIFEVHHMVFKYNVCLKEYIDLLLRLVNGNILKDIEPLRRIGKNKS